MIVRLRIIPDYHREMCEYNLKEHVITDNRSVSRSHATLVIRNDVCYIMDNGSLNKTYINGSALVPKTECVLSNGDNIKLYNERFVYLKYHN